MNPNVYISIGSNATPAQKSASEAIFRAIESIGLSPRQMEKNEWTAEQPLRGIRRVIDECDGIAVIAFPRYSFPAGTERQRDGSDKPIENVRMTTVWNQVEAALGYARNLPLLVIAEEGLLDDGLIEGKYDWKVFWTSFTPEDLQSERFYGYLQSWKRLVLNRSATAMDLPPAAPGFSPATPDSSKPDVSKMTLKQLAGCITGPQAWALVVAIATLLAAVAGLAYKFGGANPAGH